MQVRQHFDVHRHHVGAGVDERLDVAVGLRRSSGARRAARVATRLQRAHDRRPDRDVRHEVAVHDVDVNQVGAAALDRGDVAAEVREVRGQRIDGARRTAIIGSPRARWIAGMHLEAAGGRLPHDHAGRNRRGADCDTIETRKPRLRSTSAARSPSTPIRSGMT